MSTTTTPTHYLLPLYPGFQLLDVAGPLDMLNLLTLTHPPCANLTLTIIASTLDPVPVKPIPPIDPSTSQPKWTFSNDPQKSFPTINNSTNTLFNQFLVPDVTFASYLDALSSGSISPTGPHKPIDVLLIPGGIGSRIDREQSGPLIERYTSNVGDLLAFLPRVAPHVRHSIVTVCTGSDILAQSGLLDARRATTNMSRFDEVAARSPGVKWLKARRYVRSVPEEVGGGAVAAFPRDIWTSAGISAGMDVMLAFIAEYYGGVEVARMTAKRLEYEWREIGEGAVDPMYGLKAEDVGVVDQS